MSNIKGVPTALGPVTFAQLPPAAQYRGAVVFCSNARRGAEGAGVGTGNLLFSNGTVWVRTDTGATADA
jgi:hypothetical protein